MCHIQKYHKNILITCVKCGCDGDGKRKHLSEGFRDFHSLQNHIRGIYRREREIHYNIHYRARRERDEPLERHVGFAIKQVKQLWKGWNGILDFWLCGFAHPMDWVSNHDGCEQLKRKRIELADQCGMLWNNLVCHQLISSKLYYTQRTYSNRRK